MEELASMSREMPSNELLRATACGDCQCYRSLFGRQGGYKWQAGEEEAIRPGKGRVRRQPLRVSLQQTPFSTARRGRRQTAHRKDPPRAADQFVLDPDAPCSLVGKLGAVLGDTYQETEEPKKGNKNSLLFNCCVKVRALFTAQPNHRRAGHAEAGQGHQAHPVGSCPSMTSMATRARARACVCV